MELAGAPSLQHGSSTLPSTKYSIQIPQYISLYSCQVHPSAVDLEVSRFRNKMVINVLGEQKRIMKPAKEEGDYSDLITNCLILFLKNDKARLLCYVRSIKF